MTEVTIRPAGPQDAADLARLDNIAGHGFTNWYWSKRAEEQGNSNPVAMAQKAMADPEYQSGWKQTVLAMKEGEVAGGANGYLMVVDQKMGTPSKEPVFEPVRQLFAQTAGDWLVDWLAVYEKWQGRGIGACLLDACLARAKGVSSRISLVVEDANRPALALYKSRGFQQRDQRPYIPFNTTSKTKNWLLLSAPVM